MPQRDAGGSARFFDLRHAKLVVTRRTLAASGTEAHVTQSALPRVASFGGRFGNSTSASRWERIARALVSHLHRLRRDMKLAVGDRIRVRIVAPDQIESAVSEYYHWIANELLAREVAVGEPPVGQQAVLHVVNLDGFPVRVALTREL